MEYPYYHLYFILNKKEIKELIGIYTPIIYNKIPNDLKKIDSKNKLEKYNNEYFIIKENFLDTYIINNLTELCLSRQITSFLLSRNR